MARFNYARPRATAKRLIERFGMPVRMKRTETVSSEVWYEFEPGPAQIVEILYTITVVDLNSQLRPVGRGDPAVLQKHQVIIAPDAPVEPRAGDSILFLGSEFAISEVRPVAPGGLLIMWEADLAA